jgi:hypothetical protein
MINHIYRGIAYQPASTSRGSTLDRVFCYRGVTFRPSQRKVAPEMEKNRNSIIYRGVEAI